jgi:hypothetical protein
MEKAWRGRGMLVSAGELWQRFGHTTQLQRERACGEDFFMYVVGQRAGSWVQAVVQSECRAAAPTIRGRVDIWILADGQGSNPAHTTQSPGRGTAGHTPLRSKPRRA